MTKIFFGADFYEVEDEENLFELVMLGMDIELSYISFTLRVEDENVFKTSF